MTVQFRIQRDHRRVHEAETTIRRNAFDPKSNSLKSTNHRENDRPPLRLNVANKTPLHGLVKCSSMEFVLARLHIAESKYSVKWIEIARSCFLFVITLETSQDKKVPFQHRHFFAFIECFSLFLARLQLSFSLIFLHFENCKRIILLVYFWLKSIAQFFILYAHMSIKKSNLQSNLVYNRYNMYIQFISNKGKSHIAKMILKNYSYSTEICSNIFL